MDSFYITLIEYVLLLLFCAISTAIAAFALFLLYRLNRHRNFNAAPSLIVYLSSFGVCCAALTVQYTLLTLSSVFSSQSLFSSLSPTQYIFWTGLIPGSLIPATPICVFFLSIDRLLIILKPSIYNSRRWIKQILAAFSLISVVALFGMSFGVNLAQRPRTEHPECISFGCLTSDASRLIYAVNRLAVALPNFLAGTAFLAALFAFRRRLERLNRTTINSTVGPSFNLPTKTAMVNTDSRKMSDRLTFHCVLFEFLLDLLPNLR
uniref:G_PROTEIN_RECEP_F1_2 domain-containing protein n=1 Tax=Globodera pallida TaxID=36090 RepID=A0A183BMX8_GLOPA